MNKGGDDLCGGVDRQDAGGGGGDASGGLGGLLASLEGRASRRAVRVEEGGDLEAVGEDDPAAAEPGDKPVVVIANTVR